MELGVPEVSVSASLARPFQLQARERETVAFGLPPYCFDQGYVYSEGTAEYTDNYCLNFLQPEEYTVVNPDSVHVSTYTHQVGTPISRRCAARARAGAVDE